MKEDVLDFHIGPIWATRASHVTLAWSTKEIKNSHYIPGRQNMDYFTHSSLGSVIASLYCVILWHVPSHEIPHFSKHSFFFWKICKRKERKIMFVFLILHPHIMQLHTTLAQIISSLHKKFAVLRNFINFSAKIACWKGFGWKKFKKILRTKIIYCEKLKKTFLPLVEEDDHYKCPCIWSAGKQKNSAISSNFSKTYRKTFSVIWDLSYWIS